MYYFPTEIKSSRNTNLRLPAKEAFLYAFLSFSQYLCALGTSTFFNCYFFIFVWVGFLFLLFFYTLGIFIERNNSASFHDFCQTCFLLSITKNIRPKSNKIIFWCVFLSRKSDMAARAETTYSFPTNIIKYSHTLKWWLGDSRRYL